MALFAKEPGSETAAITQVAETANQLGSRVIVPKTGATTALTASEMVNAIVRQSGTNGALSVATATAAAIVALIENCQVGSAFELEILNTNDNTITLTAGAGVTLVGTTAVGTNKSQIYRGVVTNVDTPAVSLVGILYAPA